jgi:fructose-1-phosphate kinase PfkB-like protein
LDKADMLSGCYELLNRGAKRVLLSLGKQGAVITDGTHNYYCKSMNVAVNSTVGAGDGMVAAAALQLQRGEPLSEILRSGVAAGTATVMTKGKTSFTKEKYQEVIANLRVVEI